jgi:hypothetical protein
MTRQAGVLSADQRRRSTRASVIRCFRIAKTPLARKPLAVQPKNNAFAKQHLAIASPCRIYGARAHEGDKPMMW